MALNNLSLRAETREDQAAVFNINAAAFGRPDEARLVDGLRNGDSILRSLVAELDGSIIGHALFTTVRLAESISNGAALGPIAVLPEFQAMGVGSVLIKRGLSELTELGIGFCIVLGHSEYYPRFGFIRASVYGLNCQWAVPDEVFMAIELHPGALKKISGTVYYAEEFNQVT